MHGTVTNQVASVTPGAGAERVIMKSEGDGLRGRCGRPLAAMRPG